MRANELSSPRVANPGLGSRRIPRTRCSTVNAQHSCEYLDDRHSGRGCTRDRRKYDHLDYAYLGIIPTLLLESCPRSRIIVAVYPSLL